LIFWARNQGMKMPSGMFVCPQHVSWAPINPFMEYKAHAVREDVLRGVCWILQWHLQGKGLWSFRNWSVAHTLEFLNFAEQGQLLEVMKEHYHGNS